MRSVMIMTDVAVKLAFLMLAISALGCSRVRSEPPMGTVSTAGLTVELNESQCGAAVEEKTIYSNPTGGDLQVQVKNTGAKNDCTFDVNFTCDDGTGTQKTVQRARLAPGQTSEVLGGTKCTKVVYSNCHGGTDNPVCKGNATVQ